MFDQISNNVIISNNQIIVCLVPALFSIRKKSLTGFKYFIIRNIRENNIRYIKSIIYLIIYYIYICTCQVCFQVTHSYSHKNITQLLLSIIALIIKTYIYIYVYISYVYIYIYIIFLCENWNKIEAKCSNTFLKYSASKKLHGKYREIF